MHVANRKHTHKYGVVLIVVAFSRRVTVVVWIWNACWECAHFHFCEITRDIYIYTDIQREMMD